MLTRDEIVESLRKNQPYLNAEFGVKRIGLFGSYAKGVPREASDVDLLVEFDPPIGLKFIEFTEYLERLLGKPVDVLTPAGLRGIRVDRVARDIRESVVYV